MSKKYKSIYSVGGLLIKKKNLQIIQAINMIRVFSSLRFFKADYYPFDYNKFKKFYNELVKYNIYSNFFIFLKGLYFYFLKILIKNKVLKNKFYLEIQRFLLWYKKKILNVVFKKHLEKFKNFRKLKFKFKKIKKIRYLKKSYKDGKKRVKKSKKQLMIEDKKMEFFSALVENQKNLRVIYHYVKTRRAKGAKKRIMYFRKKKQNTPKVLRKEFSDDIVYKKIRARRKRRKILYRKLRLNYKGNYSEKEESALDLFNILNKDKSNKKIRWYLKRRKKKYWRNFFLMKKYKRIISRRKNKRTGILHFRMYYSNYYITLTDLSYNVIYSCSAGSVSDTNNKKTKMSNVVSMPIFYRILFFLRANRIKNLKFVARTDMEKIFSNALLFFKTKYYNIKSVSVIKKAPHHLGQRKQKPRRI